MVLSTIKNIVHPLVQNWQYGNDGYWYWDPGYKPTFDDVDAGQTYHDDWSWDYLGGGFPSYA